MYVGLGAYVRLSSNPSTVYYDPTHDTYVKASQCISSCSRLFSLSGLSPGTYDVGAALWSGQPDETPYVILWGTSWQLEALTIYVPSVTTDKSTYNQGDTIYYTGSGFTPNGQVHACLTTTSPSVTCITNEPNADSSGNVAGSFTIGLNWPTGSQDFWVYDVATNTNSNSIPLTINLLTISTTQSTTSTATFTTTTLTSSTITAPTTTTTTTTSTSTGMSGQVCTVTTTSISTSTLLQAVTTTSFTSSFTTTSTSLTSTQLTTTALTSTSIVTTVTTTTVTVCTQTSTSISTTVSTYTIPPVAFGSVSSVVSAGVGSAWFVLPDYTAGQGSMTHYSAVKCGGVRVALATDVYAGTYLFGSLTNPQQNEILDTKSAYVSQSSSSCGQPKPSTNPSQPLVAIAGPAVNEVVYYYESVEKSSPLYYNFANGCITRRDTGVGVSCNFPSTPTSDVFVMEAFIDQAGRTVYVIYGLNWPGTLAGYEVLVNFVLRNTSGYSKSWYVYKWTDATSGVSANSIPDPGDTYTQIASGP